MRRLLHQLRRHPQAPAPNEKQFRALVGKIRNAGGRFSQDCADFVEFLAYSGLRKGEAQYVRWEHCDLARGELLVVGDPETATKNGEIRRIPIIPSMVDLLKRIKAHSPDSRPGALVLQVREAQKAMDILRTLVQVSSLSALPSSRRFVKRLQ